MKVNVFGLPGMKARQALINVTAAVTAIDPSIGVEWISDANEMLEYGIARTPTVMVDERINFEGRIPSIHEVTTWIQEGQLMEAEA
ncbi:MAG TPA: thioredoxin family protein [Bacteroidota bacterium]|nr:thioredoxin family protein [Bacteroidota bacterium]